MTKRSRITCGIAIPAVLEQTMPVSTVTEIEEAISRLPEPERELLESRLVAHRFGLDALSDDVQEALLASLRQSRKEVSQGEVFTADQLRSEIGGWVGK